MRRRACRKTISTAVRPWCHRGKLEMLAEKTWTWLASYGIGMLNLQLAGVGAEPHLHGLSEAVRNRLHTSATFVHPNKPLRVDMYGHILGIPAGNLVWSYLNKKRTEMTSMAA